MAAQLITVRLSRGDAQPWGFRLQGGADFGTPLVVQKVNGGSLADQAGLMPGDAVIKINETDIFPLRHKDAQDLVVRSGNTFVMSVQRGGSTWRPHVTPTGQMPSHQSHLGSNISTVTRTSLAHKQPQPVEHIGCGYNNAARPFNSINGGDGHVKSIVNKQYNTPVGIYSEEAIAETLSAQAEVLAGGVLGVNFKKNEKEYNPTNSEVLKFLKEEESHPQEQEPYAPANFFWTASHAIGGRKSPGHPKTPTQQTDERVGTQLEQNTLAPNAAHRPSLPQNLAANTSASVTESAPVLPSWKPDSSIQQHQPQQQQQQPQQQQQQQQQQQPQQQQEQEDQQTNQVKSSTTEGPKTKAGLPQCANCGIGIVGVFCRIKDKNLHVECFKCATCGTPLKNQGYYNYNNKLYCDIHAKLAAMQNPPPGTEGYIPIPIKPTPKLSAGTIANALNAHGYNLQTNGATPNIITGPMPSSGNHEQNITSSANPLQVSHSRASSSSSTSSGTTGKSSSCLSSLSQQSCTSLDKFSTGHTRQSSLGGGGVGGGGVVVGGEVGDGFTEGTGIDRIDGITHNMNGSKNDINNGLNTSYNHSQYNQQSTFNSQTNLSLSIPTTSPQPIQLAPTISNNQLESKLGKNSINFEQNSSIKSTMNNNNNNNMQNENDMNTNNNGQNNQTTNIYNQFLNKYSNKCTNRVDDNGIDSQQRAISPFPNIPFPPESDDPMYGKISPFPTIPPPINQQMQYVTLQGNIIRSVIPPGKGISVDYKIGSHGGPRPFNQGPMSPQMGGPRSPAQSSYPPPQQQQQQQQYQQHQQHQQQQNWSQQSKSVGQSPYATLPRTNASQQQEEERQTLVDSSVQIERQKQQHPDHFEDAEVAAVNTVQRNIFEWPPKNLEGHNTPTAAPLYIPPPETQHVIAKPIQERIEQKQANFEQEQEIVQQQKQQYQPQWQSRSAPELTTDHQQVELESSSDSYTSTSTTTTTTSEEYNRMYQAQVQAYQMQQMYDQQSGSEIDYHMDMEVAAAQQNQEQLYSSSSDFMTYHTGRRSAQECVESLSGTLSTYKLIDLVREVTPSPTPMNKPGKRVEFADNVTVKEHESEEYVSYNQSMQQTNIDQESEPVVEEEIHPETYSQCEQMYATKVDKPTERLFPPTPKIDIEIAEVKHIPPTNIPNPIPKEWINPMVRALTIAPDKPVEIHPSCEFYCGSTQCENFCEQYSEQNSMYNAQLVNNEEEKPKEPGVLQETPPRGTFITRVMATAPTDTYKFNANSIDPVPLPEETEPYMPAPIDMKPYVREDYRPKSPFLSALITAPDRSYTPFGHDVCSQLLDLPTPKEKLTMKDALVTAPDISYSNLDPENILKLHLDEQSEKKDFIYLTTEEQKTITEKKIEENLEEHMDRQISAFATLSGYRPVKPFQIQSSEPSITYGTPRNSLASSDQQYITNNHRDSLQSLSSIQNSECTYNKKQAYPNNNNNESYNSNKIESQYHHYQPNTVSSQISSSTNEASKKSHETISTSLTSTSSIQTAEQKISNPSAHGPNSKRALTSGLHKPDNIPQYQRNWTMLQSQRPVRTPEPDELKQNVPLAFVDAPKEQTPTQHLDVPNKKQHHLLRGVSPTSDFSGSAIVNPHMTGPITNNQSPPKQSIPKSVPLIIEERVGPITMTFQSLDDIPDDRSQSSISRPYTPSLMNKPAPIIPYYQTPDKLVCEECPSVESRPYDRRSASPFPDRARSPAPGPPPNPLKTIAIHAPRVKENEPKLTLPRTPQAGSITTGQSYLGTQMAQQKQQGQVLSHYQTSSQASAQSYTENPQIVQQQTIGDKTIQTKQNESHSMAEQKSEMVSNTTTQVGNAQIERRRKVVEEYEHSQSAKTVEIRTQVGKTGFVANQARRLSELDQQISSVASQSKAISARANNLDPNETKFPEIKSPIPSTSFPLKPVYPPHDEPQRPTYVVPTSADNKMVGPPPGFLQRFESKQNQQESAASRANVETSYSQSSSYAASSVSQSSSLAVQKSSFNSTNSSFTNQDNLNSKLISAIPVPAFKPPMLSFGSNNNTTNSNTKPQEQNVGKSSTMSNNTYRPTASTGPAGFKPTQPGSYKSVEQPNKAPMPSFEPPQQQLQAQQQPSLASNLTNSNVNLSDSNNASAGPSGGNKAVGGAFGATSAPKRGRGTLNKAVGPGGRIPTCGCCGTQIRGPFITALGRIWCPEHFMCVNGSCRRPLQDIGFVEEKGDLYCEYCFEKYLAPTCSKCNNKIKGDCLNAIGRHFHPECFTCAYCGKLFGNTPFFLEEGEPYCETDWNELFTTKCYACGFPVEAGDRWVEALNHNYHSQCFNCTMCKKNLEGTSFYNKGGRPFCKNHAR